MAQERTKLPDRHQIDGITSVDALSTMLDEVIDAKLQIEVDLEHRTDADMDWERRARAALLAHRICEKNVRRRLGQLTRKGNHHETEAQQQHAKALRQEAQSREVLAAAERKKAQAVEQRARAMASLRDTLVRSDYFRHFHKAAHELLGDEVCRAVTAQAQRMQAAAAEALLATAAGPEPEESTS